MDFPYFNIEIHKPYITLWYYVCDTLMYMEDFIMGASKKIKKVIFDKDVKREDLAMATGRAVGTLNNLLAKDHMMYSTVEEILYAMRCEIVFRDKETGKIYD